MGHIGNVKDEYRAWVQRLAAGTTGAPEPATPGAWEGWREVLEILCTPEQAWLASRLPVLPATLEKVAARTGLSARELLPKLEALCDRGIVLDLIDPRTGETTYFLAPSVIGFFEFSMMRAHDGLPKKRLAEAMEAYFRGDETLAREVFGFATQVGRALVNEESLDDGATPEVLDWERATALIREARSIGVSLCYCRHKAQHLGQACDAPTENCLSIGDGAGFVLRRGFARPIERSEALQILDQARERGLVQIADNVRSQPSYICNCCGCCCGQLQAITVYGLHAVNPSAFVPRLSGERCSGCGLCAKACPICALELVPAGSGERRDARPRIDPERCIGCGVCASRCARKALRMAPREERPYVPLNTVERILRQALERGRLANFVFDEGAGRGSKFFNRVLKALGDLPPAKRALANEQLRSRFVRVALFAMREPKE